MMFENNPDVIQVLVMHRQTDIRNAMERHQGHDVPHPLRPAIGRILIRMGEVVRGPEMSPRTADSRPAMPTPSMRRAHQA